MGLKETIVAAVDTITDKVNELGHNANAEAESAKRDVAGDTMTPGEQLGSIVNEGKERVLAGVDGAKADARNS
jgi:hypothetical protein